MIPAALFWAMVLAGSFHSLIAFGREVLGWHHGWEYLVPGTLDGVSVTFAFLAIRAVHKQKAPDRCNRVVWGTAIASATVNFVRWTVARWLQYWLSTRTSIQPTTRPLYTGYIEQFLIPHRGSIRAGPPDRPAAMPNPQS